MFAKVRLILIVEILTILYLHYQVVIGVLLLS